jgi:hypothetical protein
MGVQNLSFFAQIVHLYGLESATSSTAVSQAASIDNREASLPAKILRWHGSYGQPRVKVPLPHEWTISANETLTEQSVES